MFWLLLCLQAPCPWGTFCLLAQGPVAQGNRGQGSIRRAFLHVWVVEWAGGLLQFGKGSGMMC